MLAHYFQTDESAVTAKAIMDPRVALEVDVAALRAAPGLPAACWLSGLNYVVTTGLVEVVVPPAPIR